MDESRRKFIQYTAAVGLGFLGLRTFCAGEALADPAAVGYGPLIPDPKKIFDLPRGFSYQVISEKGQTMADGFYVPAAPDAMATFPGPGGKTLIIRNHELNPDKPELGAFGKNHELLPKIDRAKMYDYGKGKMPGLGGTTTLVYDTTSRKLESQFLSLAGTHRNCAGGLTPWNTWITCEETVQKAENDIEKDHGYVFEVPVSAQPGLADPVPLKGMGRFNHEAVSVDPASGVVFLTEDRPDGLIYRYIPVTPGKLAAGGRLQALSIRDMKSAETANAGATRTIPVGKPLETAWLDIDHIDSPDDDLRTRGFAKGAANFARGEGMWYGNKAVYFAATIGGRKQKGQIWRYLPSPDEGKPEETKNPGKLELFAEPDNAKILELADNITVAPWGDLIICEDGAGEDFLHGLTPQGQFYKIGRNALNIEELSGACFSPDGSTLFVNMQGAGLTLAITGPWRKAG